jgi:hypothetical protein
MACALAHRANKIAYAMVRTSTPTIPAAFDLIVSRHPTVTPRDEIARVLRPGGTYLSQQIGADSAT